MRKKFIPLILIPVVLLLPAMAEMSDSKDCTSTAIYPETLEAPYPAHQFSPKKALNMYENVFLGRVLVPTRKCSLGYCAGIEVIKNIKGHASQKSLIKITNAKSECLPTKYSHKGVSWLIFASTGITQRGTKYLQIEVDSPSFQTRLDPNFEILQKRYEILQARIDQAITEKVR